MREVNNVDALMRTVVTLMGVPWCSLVGSRLRRSVVEFTRYMYTLGKYRVGIGGTVVHTRNRFVKIIHM